ncbi:MAG TPA: hypothetical protein VHT01_03260 [Candidatus Udaeobacter sp.]|nr:hypothetical protein [Candidatus Udaeobacter sp.]
MAHPYGAIIIGDKAHGGPAVPGTPVERCRKTFRFVHSASLGIMRAREFG